ncbi:31196_t:CDS:2, partial [Racocetra persica]
ELDKATVTRAFNEQLEWLIENGVESEREKAKYLKKQFQINHYNGYRDPWDYVSCTGTPAIGTRRTTSPARVLLLQTIIMVVGTRGTTSPATDHYNGWTRGTTSPARHSCYNPATTLQL